MNQNHALITSLFLLTAITIVISGQRTFPICTPPDRSSQDRDAHFLFFVDRTLEAGSLSRLFYLLKAISCEIPLNKKILSIVVAHSDAQFDFSNSLTSDGIPTYLEKREFDKTVDEFSTRCTRFEKALGRAPPPFLAHRNVQFMVPIFEDGSGCSMLKVFQSHFQNDSRKDNFYFNGILINSELTPENNQSIRMVIPNITKAIDPGRISLVGSKNISDVHQSAPLVQSYASMIRDILLGNSVHDWEEILTTPGPSTSSESPPTTTTEDELALFKFDGDDEEEAEILELNSTTSEVVESTNDTTTFQVTTSESSSTTTSQTTSRILEKSEKRAALASSTTSEATSNATSESPKNSTSTEELDLFDLDLMDGVVAKGDTDNATSLIPDGTTPGRWSHFETDTMIYLLLLFLLIWIFCLFLCLVWMFYCAKKKKAKLENEAENQQSEPLLESGPSGASGVAKTSEVDKKSGTASDEGEDEWKSIKPSTRAEMAPKSETESVKPVAARYDPVEVSDFEKNDEDFDEKPRHGYMPTKKTQDLQFD